MTAIFRSLVGFGLMLSLLLLAGCSSELSGSVEPEPEPDERAVTLYFYSETDLENATFDAPVPVSRSVVGDTDAEAMDRTLKLLFAGPTTEEKAAGAQMSEDLSRLSPLYLGVRMENGVAHVNFRQTALTTLNAAAARQIMVKSPIERTLKQFPGVTEVRYEIDGQPFDQWDA